MSENNPEIKNDGNDKKKNILIIEIIVAVIAIAVVGILLFVKTNKDKADNTADQAATQQEAQTSEASTDGTSDTTATEATSDSDSATASSLKDDPMPAIPADVAQYNLMTEEDAAALAESGDMLRIDMADGTYAYVNNYKNDEYFKEYIKVSDKDIKDLIYAQITVNYVEDAPEGKATAEWYDVVNIDYAGKIDDVAFDGGTAQGQSLALGSGQFIPGFEEGVVGMNVGETKDILTHFPENYTSSDLAGKDAIFTVTLNSITSVGVELTDEMAQSYSPEFQTTADIETFFRKGLTEEKISAFLTERYYVSNVSEDAIKDYYNSTIDYYEQMFAAYGATVDDLLASSGKSKEEFLDDTMVAAVKSALSVSIFKAISEELNVSPTQEDIDAFVAQYGCSDINEMYDSYGKNTVDDYLLNQTVLDNLYNN